MDALFDPSDPSFLPLLALILLWILPWKALALWKAARLSQKGWFIIILLSNTLAILDIVYIFLIASRYKVESIEVPEPESDDKNNGVDMA